MSKMSCGLLLASGVAIWVLFPLASGAADISGATPEIESAVLAEHWDRVVDACGPNDQLLDLPVLRCIKAHGLLALNGNDDALLLFLSISNDADRKAWGDWTQSLTERHPSSSVAHYLAGDATARLGRWESAVKSLDRSIELNPSLALALNGRGVCFAHLERWDDALEDLETVCDVSPLFADGCASLANLLVLKRAPEGALVALEKALESSPQNALALNGRGCAKFGKGHWAAAATDFEAAAESYAVARLALSNSNALIGADLELSQKALSDTAGMTVDVNSRINQLERNIRHNERTLQVMPWLPSLSLGKLGWDKDGIVGNTKRNLSMQRTELDALRRMPQFTPKGGVSTEELRRAFVDTGEWPVAGRFGLAYVYGE